MACMLSHSRAVQAASSSTERCSCVLGSNQRTVVLGSCVSLAHRGVLDATGS